MATMKTLNGYGFNATELNGKTASDYLQKTDTATNSAKLGGKAPEYYIQPRNLLDNSDFRNPVNQRGVTNTSTVGYCIDRWVFSLSGSGGLSVQDGSLAFNASDGSYCEILQIQESSSTLSEKEMTFAVCISPGNIICLNFTYGTDTSVLSADGKIALIHYTGDRLYIRFFSTGNNWIRIYWAALYEGSYTADTLPPYVQKGDAAELAECMRYYYCLQEGTNFIFRTRNQRGPNKYSAIDMCPHITFPVPMRIVPTVSMTYNTTDGTSSVGAPFDCSRTSCTVPDVAIPPGGWFALKRLVASADL